MTPLAARAPSASSRRRSAEDRDPVQDFGEPVAAASIAQVHRADRRTATATSEVAVKVLRPGVERRFARDLSDMFFAARLAERFRPNRAG